MPILNQVQVNLIYNTNRNLFLWIEIFISTTDLYNTTADRWSCHLPNRNKQFTCFQWGGRSFCVQISRERSYPCQYIDTTRKAIDFATTLQQTSSFVKIVRKTTNIGIWPPFWESWGLRRTLVDGRLECPCWLLDKWHRTFQGEGSSLRNIFLVSRKLNTFCYLTMQTAPCYAQSFWHNTGGWQTDGRTDGWTELP